MLRLGLCCIFRKAPVRFKRTTAKALKNLGRKDQLDRLSDLCLQNARSLAAALDEVHRLGIGAFRVLTPLFPLFTHPAVGYRLRDLPASEEIFTALAEVRHLAHLCDIRLSFHPDQFTLLSSPLSGVTEASLGELAYQGLLADLIGADVINIHGGGAYGDKESALTRFAEHFARLPQGVRQRLTVENDDITYTVKDLLPLCEKLQIPLVYDVHHHRCNPDGLSVTEATRLALATWAPRGCEPCLHISSPKHGWGDNPRPHADFIDARDFPEEWKGLDATVEVEAKAKEEAVIKLQRDLGLPPWRSDPGHC